MESMADVSGGRVLPCCHPLAARRLPAGGVASQLHPTLVPWLQGKPGHGMPWLTLGEMSSSLTDQGSWLTSGGDSGRQPLSKAQRRQRRTIWERWGITQFPGLQLRRAAWTDGWILVMNRARYLAGMFPSCQTLAQKGGVGGNFLRAAVSASQEGRLPVCLPAFALTVCGI